MYKSYIKSNYLELNTDFELFTQLLQTHCSMEKMIPIAQRICKHNQVTHLSTEQAEYMIKKHLNNLPFIKHHYFTHAESRKKKAQSRKKKRPKKYGTSKKWFTATVLATAAVLATSVGVGNATKNTGSGNNIIRKEKNVASCSNNTCIKIKQNTKINDTPSNINDTPSKKTETEIKNNENDVTEINVPDPNAANTESTWFRWDRTNLINVVYKSTRDIGFNKLQENYEEIDAMLQKYKNNIDTEKNDNYGKNVLDYTLDKLYYNNEKYIGYTILQKLMPFLKRNQAIKTLVKIIKMDSDSQNDEVLNAIFEKDKASVKIFNANHNDTEYYPFIYDIFIGCISGNIGLGDDDRIKMFERINDYFLEKGYGELNDFILKGKNENAWSPLHYAIDNWDEEKYLESRYNQRYYTDVKNMKKIVKKLLPLKDVADKNSWTPLLLGVDRHKYSLVQILLDNGAKITNASNYEITNDDGDSLLKIIQNRFLDYKDDKHYEQQLELIIELIDKGANPNLKNKKGISAYMLCKNQLELMKYKLDKNYNIYVEKGYHGALVEGEYDYTVELYEKHLPKLLSYYETKIEPIIDKDGKAIIDKDGKKKFVNENDENILKELLVKEKKDIDKILEQKYIERREHKTRKHKQKRNYQQKLIAAAFIESILK